ncbi:MAG: PadR family transcriptional regulator [Candidatus Thorarchaeota archaeon]
MLMLDRHPIHGYEIRRQLVPLAGDIEVTTLYRWLREMEKEGLIESKAKKGPHGPERKEYRMGSRGERHLREVLRDSMRVILHFYDEFRHYSFAKSLSNATSSEHGQESIEGRIIVAIVTPSMADQVDTMKLITNRAGENSIHVMGDPKNLVGLDKKFILIEGSPWDIPCKKNHYHEYWILGMPARELLPRTLVESKRILDNGGTVRMHVPFAFFDEPAEPTLESFLRLTASHLFPELGVVEGQEVCDLFEKMFEDFGIIKFHPGHVQFWGTNSSE